MTERTAIGVRAKNALTSAAVLAYNLSLMVALRRPAYPDADQFDWARELERNWATIRAEVDDLLASGPTIPSYVEADPSSSALWDKLNKVIGRVRPVAHSKSASLDRWQTFMFRSYGLDIEANRARCPNTARLLDQVPGMTAAMFSVLDAGVRIPPHLGLFMGALRFHLGVLVPPGHQAGIKVSAETRYWDEGEYFVFEHSRWHTAWNLSDQPRVVLIVDFERPFRSRWMTRLNHRIVRLVSESPRADEAKAALEAIGQEPARQRSDSSARSA